MTAPKLVYRFRGDHDTQMVLVQRVRSQRILARYAAHRDSPGWNTILVGTAEELRSVHAFPTPSGQWIWRDGRTGMVIYAEVAP